MDEPEPLCARFGGEGCALPEGAVAVDLESGMEVDSAEDLEELREEQAEAAADPRDEDDGPEPPTTR